MFPRIEIVGLTDISSAKLRMAKWIVSLVNKGAQSVDQERGVQRN
jgi:hypothetical protein